MESLSPLVKNSSVRRLSLELCQKFATNFLQPSTSPSSKLGQNQVGQSSSPVFKSARRASLSTTPTGGRRASLTQQQNNLNFPRNTNNVGISSSTTIAKIIDDNYKLYGNQQNQPPDNVDTVGVGVVTKGNHRRKRSIVPANSSPKRRASLSFTPLFNIQTSSGLLEKRKAVDVDFDRTNSTPPHKEVTERGNHINPTCQIIPPTPKRRSSLSSFIPLINIQKASPTSPDINSTLNSDVQLVSQLQRRKSSSSQYDFQVPFISFVSEHWDLQMDPEEILGRGSFGTVLAAKYKGCPVAVKVLRKKSPLRGELNGLHLPRHENVVHILDIFRPPGGEALVILEKMQRGNLLSVINDPDVDLPFDKVVDFSVQIASALVFIHGEGLLHLDVKPQNVLLGKGGLLKLGDFGNSKKIQQRQKELKQTEKLDGTVCYKAPELFRGEIATDKCDIYSTGITMWQLLTRQQPYVNENYRETEHSIIYKVVAQNLRPTTLKQARDESPTEVEFINLYKLCWHPCHSKRPTSLGLKTELYKII